MTQHWHERLGLPPMPNLHTGEPRPPAAPRECGGLGRTPTDRAPRRPPAAPPAELGATLEWSQPSPRQIVTGVTTIVGFIALVGTLMSDGFGWIGDVTPWIILGLSFAAFLSMYVVDWTATGATWVQSRKDWVNTYQLTRIRFDVQGLNRVLKLEDADGRTIRSLQLRAVQANPAMWDLIYNGILHSVASGNCDISKKARSVLKIPPHLGQ